MTIGEIYELTWDEDNKLTPTPVLGSRRTGTRRGRFDVKGTMKNYWINGPARAMLQGQTANFATGSASAIYHSQSAFNRYMIQVSSSNAAAPVGNFLIYNVVFGTDAMSMTTEKVVDETITWVAEDIFGL